MGGIQSGSVADYAVKQIIDDLTNRRGLGHEWDAIDDDIQAEIKARWTEIIEDAIIESYESPEEHEK